MTDLPFAPKLDTIDSEASQPLEELTSEEDAGLRGAMDELDAGLGVTFEDAISKARAIINRCPSS